MQISQVFSATKTCPSDNLRATSNKDVDNNRFTAFKTKRRRYVSSPFKLLYNSTLLQISQWNACCRGFSFTNTGVSGSKSETIVQCSACHSISVFTFYLLCRRKCTYSRTCLCLSASRCRAQF